MSPIPPPDATHDQFGRPLHPIAAAIQNATVMPGADVGRLASIQQAQQPVQQLNITPDAVTPAETAREKLGPPPDPRDAQYKNSRGRTILNMIGAGLTGAASPQAGIALGRELRDVKYNKAKANYENQLSALGSQEKSETAPYERGLEKAKLQSTYNVERTRQQSADAASARAETYGKNEASLEESRKAAEKEKLASAAEKEARNAALEKAIQTNDFSDYIKAYRPAPRESEEDKAKGAVNKQRMLNADTASDPNAAKAAQIKATARATADEAAKPGVPDNVMQDIKSRITTDPGSAEAVVKEMTPKQRMEVYASAGIPTHLDPKQQDRLYAAKITTAHADSLQKMADDPWIASHLGPIAGRILDAKGTIGGSSNAQNKVEEEKEGQFLSMLTQVLAWESTNLSGGSRPAWQLVQLLKKTGVKAADSPARLRGALDAIRISANNVQGSILPKDNKDIKTTPGGTKYTIDKE